MTPSSRDRITVDLRGLRSALFERARALGVSPSGLLRDALIASLGQRQLPPASRLESEIVAPTRHRVRLSLRMAREDALATLAAARRASQTPGAFVAGLVAGVPALSAGASRSDYLAALVASSAELSTLSRNIHHLTSLLRDGNVPAASVYREMLDTLAGNVQAHLTLASRLLTDLQPRNRAADPSRAPGRKPSRRNS